MKTFIDANFLQLFSFLSDQFYEYHLALPLVFPRVNKVPFD